MEIRTNEGNPFTPAELEIIEELCKFMLEVAGNKHPGIVVKLDARELSDCDSIISKCRNYI